MNHMQAMAELQAALGHKRLTKGFAKLEIVLCLSGVWVGLWLLVASARSSAALPLLLVASFVLFVLGGYLGMAGSRSHFYQSSNELTAYLAWVLRQERPIR